MIKVYSSPTCSWCKKVKSYLEVNNVEYLDANVAEDKEEREEMINLSGQQGVPVINIDEKIIIGFDKIAIDKALHDYKE